MTKKILAAVIAVMMVMALAVSAFAADVTDMNDGAKDVYDGENAHVAIPEGVDTADGAVITVHVVGHSDNTQFRLYLTNAGDANGRVSDMVYVDGGDFDITAELKVELGVYDTDVVPTHVQIKGPDYQTPLSNTTITLFEFVGAEETAAETEAEPEAEAEAEAPEAEAEAAPAETETEAAPAPEAEAAPAPAETTPAAPATGIALCVIPAVVALGAVAVSKKH